MLGRVYRKPVAAGICQCSRRYQSTAQSQGTTHFGRRTVQEEEKEQLVGNVFSSVAKKYDTMNDVMSFGVHRLWKDQFVSRLHLNTLSSLSEHNHFQVLDVAGGTGDIALRLLDQANVPDSSTNFNINVLDINPQMLKYGKKKADQRRIPETLMKFTQGNAENLESVPTSSIDLYTIAFGLRNCTHIDRVIAEAYRVLKPGGVFSCLEFSKVNLAPLATLYKAYSFSVIPIMGQIVAADRDSYQYLVESIERFPSQPHLTQMIREVGLEPEHGQGWQDLSFGIAAIHTAVKPI